jgi:hypothetical protein
MGVYDGRIMWLAARHLFHAWHVDNGMHAARALCWCRFRIWPESLTDNIYHLYHHSCPTPTKPSPHYLCACAAAALAKHA